MAGKKGENTKKVAGNAKKAEAAAEKQAVADLKSAVVDDEDWSKGAKGTAKKAVEADKKAEAARKKAERDALLAAEESSQRATAKPSNKAASKKSKAPASAPAPTLNLSQLDDDDSEQTLPPTTLNATGIDNALDALSLTTASTELKTERHPERRFKAAYAAFEDRRLPEIATEHPGLRKQQRVEICRKEFEKSEENPFNMVGIVGFDAGKEEVKEVKENVRKGVEGRLGER